MFLLSTSAAVGQSMDITVQVLVRPVGFSKVRWFRRRDYAGSATSIHTSRASGEAYVSTGKDDNIHPLPAAPAWNRARIPASSMLRVRRAWRVQAHTIYAGRRSSDSVKLLSRSPEK
jgi:hypothetical protein